MSGDIHQTLQALIRVEHLRGTQTKRSPVVTVSHDYGCGGRSLARRLSHALGVPLYDQALLDSIAASTGIDAALLARLDEQARPHWTQWLTHFQALHRQEQVQYYLQLVNLCLNILQQGGVIVGRGAHIILANHPVFRLRIVGGCDHCAARIANREGVDFATARGMAEQTNREKRRFIWDYFHRELDDPRAFDLVVNSDRMDDERLFGLLLNAIEAFQSRRT